MSHRKRAKRTNPDIIAAHPLATIAFIAGTLGFTWWATKHFTLWW